MITRIFLLAAVLLMPGVSSAVDVFADGWVPTGVVEGGQVMMLNSDGEPLPALEGGEPGMRTYPSGMEFTAVTDNEGRVVEMERGGRTFFQIQKVLQGNTYTWWIEKDQNDFLFTRPSANTTRPATEPPAADPVCEQWTTESSFLPGSETRVYTNSNQVGTGTNSSTELPVRIGPPDCSQDWMPGCIPDSNGRFVPVWLWTAKVRTCMDSRTEAGSNGTRCTDCDDGQVEIQGGNLAEIARQARAAANQELVRHVPQNLHAIATQTAAECRNFANYRYRHMDAASFDNFLSIATGSPGPGKSQADIDACRGIVQRCGRGDSCDYSVCYGIIRKCNQPGLFSGWCLRGVRETLIDAGMIPNVSTIGPRPTSPTTGATLESYGFENMIDQFRTESPPGFRNLPPGAVILYNDPMGVSRDGHAEIFTGASYCSDFCSSRPISQYRWDGRSQRRPVGIYIKTSN